MTQRLWVSGSYLKHHVITLIPSGRGRIWFVKRNQWRKFKRFIKSIDWRWNDYFCANYCRSTNGHWGKICQWKKYPSAQVYWLIGKSFQNPTSGMCSQNIWGCETPTILRHFWPQYWLFLTQMLTFWTLTFIDFLAPNRPNYWVRLISTFPPFDLNSKMIVFSRAVGWEGFFGAIMLSILLVPFYYIILPPAFCADAVEPALNGSCRLEGRLTVIKIFPKTSFGQNLGRNSAVKPNPKSIPWPLPNIQTQLMVSIKWETIRWLL